MFYTICFVQIALFISAVLADPATISLGDPSTYPTSISLTETPTGTAFSVLATSTTLSDTDLDDGINVVLSSDLQKTIQDTLGSQCDLSNPTCYPSLIQVFSDASSSIQSRQIPVIPLIVLGLVLSEIALGIAQFFQTTPPQVIHIPLDQVSQMSVAATATELAFATGSNTPYTTITPPPKVAPTTSVGVSFAISTVTAASNGQNVGDIVISLPDDLAQRIQEVINREQCSSLQKRDISDALCGAEGILMNAQPDGALSDLLLIQGLANVNIQWALASLNAAAAQAVVFAQNMADIMQVDAIIIVGLGALALALSSRQLVDNVNIQSQNTIPASEIVPQTSTLACEATSCLAGCEMRGAIQACSTTCTTVTTTDNCDSATISTTATLSIATGNINLGADLCTIVSTEFPASLQSIAGSGTQYYYMCNSTMAAINLAVSGTSTITYPALGSDPPPGYTQIPAINGQPLVTPSPTEDAQPTPTSPPASPASSPAGAPSPTSTLDPYFCGAPFC